jgi:hypothetical protein
MCAIFQILRLGTLAGWQVEAAERKEAHARHKQAQAKAVASTQVIFFIFITLDRGPW